MDMCIISDSVPSVEGYVIVMSLMFSLSDLQAWGIRSTKNCWYPCNNESLQTERHWRSRPINSPCRNQQEVESRNHVTHAARKRYSPTMTVQKPTQLFSECIGHSQRQSWNLLNWLVFRFSVIGACHDVITVSIVAWPVHTTKQREQQVLY